MALVPTAASITIRQTLDLLDGRFSTLALGVAEDGYALWLGSGISFGRVDGLKKIIPRALEFLRSRIVAGDDNCKFKVALGQALNLAQPSADEAARMDFAQPFDRWPDAHTITARLASNYARFLEIVIEGEAADRLLWDGVEVVRTFGDPALEPDAEHLCIAILVLEGVASDIASANWDGLVEKAISHINGGQASLAVYVRPEDFRQPVLRARLYKFHGCAVKARTDEANYRSSLIAAQSQINGWVVHNPLIANRLIDLVVTKPTLLMGLSVQDANIQQIFAAAEVRMPWPWPDARPSIAIAEDAIGADQRSMLRNVYRAAFSGVAEQAIISNAHIRAYAKPLLIALVLHILSAKLKALISLVPGTVPANNRVLLHDGITALRNIVSDAVGADRMAFVELLIDQMSRAIGLCRDGDTSVVPRTYKALTAGPIQQMPGDGGIPATGLREAAIALGLFGAGLDAGHWTLEPVDHADPNAGTFRVTSSARTANVYLVANSHTALLLQHKGVPISSADAIVVHSMTIPIAMARSPRAAPGRTGRAVPRQLSIASLMNEVANTNDLMQRFREECAI